MTGPRHVLRSLRLNARRRSEEHTQALVRLVLGLIASLYMTTLDFSGGLAPVKLIVFGLAAGFMAGAIAIYVSILFRPAPSPLRRCAGILLDITTTTAAMSVSGEAGTVLLALYLWVIIGNGFRFGLPYLACSTIVSLVGFSAIGLYSPFWSTHPHFVTSYLIVLVVIPAYAASLLKKKERLKRRAEEANAAKTRFLAKMSHELRTPLNGVIGMGDLLMDSELRPEQEVFARTIQGSAQTLLGIIENILDFSKIEAGRVGIESIDFDLHQLLADTIQMFRAQAERKSLRLALDIDPEAPFLLRGDPLHTRQILTNLVGNALKFTESGGVDVRVSLLAGERVPGSCRLRFEVEDTGIGIAESDLERIFDSFSQAETSTSRLYGGTGLGTAIARELALLMNGRIGVDSEPGRGSLFWVELPFVLQHEGATVRPRTLQETNILVLAAPDTARDVGELLNGWGLRFQSVRSSARAFSDLVQARRAREPFDLVLVAAPDLDMDPHQFAASVRAERLLDGTEMVMFNAPPLADSKQAGLEAGYRSVLFAPVDSMLLFNALHVAQSVHPPTSKVVSLADRYRQFAEARDASLQILVAEDNATNRMVLSGILERAGHRITAVEDGEAALDLLDDPDADFDLMILDMNMPKRGGLDVFRAYRFMTRERPIPAIVLTADATPDAMSACRDAGVDAFLTKPVETDKLLRTLASLSLSVSPARREPTAPRAEPARRKISAAATDSERLLDDAKLASLKTLGAGSDFFEELVRGFVRDSTRSIGAMVEANAARDYPALHDAIHALRGSAGELGATRVAVCCQQIRALKPFDLGTDRSRELIEQLRAAHEATAGRLAEVAEEANGTRG